MNDLDYSNIVLNSRLKHFDTISGFQNRVLKALSDKKLAQDHVDHEIYKELNFSITLDPELQKQSQPYLLSP